MIIILPDFFSFNWKIIKTYNSSVTNEKRIEFEKSEGRIKKHFFTEAQDLISTVKQPH